MHWGKKKTKERKKRRLLSLLFEEDAAFFFDFFFFGFTDMSTQAKAAGSNSHSTKSYIMYLER